jgi:catechol 2,3-dioxygenase-like lactoylglutathione lyase family enzyme
MNYQFHHAHIICKDLEQMISFFTDAIGAELIARRKFGTADGASLDIQGTTVNLRVSREDEEMVGDASQRDLTERGYTFFTPPKDTPNARIAFFKGPEDITIELVQSKE